MERQFIQMSDYTFKLVNQNNHNKAVYIKMGGQGGEGYGNVHQEFESLNRIKGFMNIPKFRYVQKPDNSVLVIENVKSKNVFESMRAGVSVGTTLTSFSTDLEKMWSETIKPMNEIHIARNIRLSSLDTAIAVSNHRGEIMNKDLIINGIKYRSIERTIQELIHKFTVKKDDVMVLAHGDEHFGNILCSDGKKPYYVIDPRMSGYYPPPQILNNLFGSYFLFMKEWSFRIANDNQGAIDIQFNSFEELETRDVLVAFISKMEESLSGISKNNLLKEYLAINLLRVIIERVNPKNLATIRKNNMAQIALANKILYDNLFF